MQVLFIGHRSELCLSIKALLMQVLINSIANAIKYNDKEKAVIEVGIEEKGLFSNTMFTIMDLG